MELKFGLFSGGRPTGINIYRFTAKQELSHGISVQALYLGSVVATVVLHR